MEQKSKTIKIKELGIEVEIDVHDKGKSFKEIKIPNGWRLLTYIESVELANSKYAKELKMFNWDDDFFIEQPFEKNKENDYVARFGADSDRAYLICNGNPGYSNSMLGVRFCRSLKDADE